MAKSENPAIKLISADASLLFEMEPSFFETFPGFSHHPKNPVSKEFERLSTWRGWRTGSAKWKKNWNRCITEQYHSLIGIRVNDLSTWQQMCRKVNLDGDFPSITKCRKALKRVYVNIVDLLECWEDEKHPRTFKNGKELSEYSHSQNKLFSRSLAKQDKVLRTLLRHIT
ncbi:hypothetical protein N7466_010741 [Penicillium verhagenii]|uniref:uncharacterized protein n=1 Tax=Penicillium verhagenii TaxID=1562060 RepID=UPI002544F962|nr:uncharacterized protein N7466_010741 [Penicillium verhagenii]KAJ5917187.1 hypothetical protein N7466_010741 [Penicillium verhagenii]